MAGLAPTGREADPPGPLSRVLAGMDAREGGANAAASAMAEISRIMRGGAVEDPTAAAAEKLKGMTMDHVTQRKAIYDAVVEPFPTKVGKHVSKKERDETGRNQANLVYGEINFESFGVAFEKIKSKYGLPGEGTTPDQGILQAPGGTFYDIGSGTGKPAVAAAVLHPFEVAGGVEILEGLYETSLQVAERFSSVGLPMLAEVGQTMETEVDFVHGDITDLETLDWTDGDIVFANSTCFDDGLMQAVAKLAVGMKKGSIVITLTKRLPSKSFKVLEQQLYQMSWGGATVYIQQKLTDPEDPEDEAEGEGGEEEDEDMNNNGDQAGTAEDRGSPAAQE